MSLWNEEGLRAVELGRRAGLEPSTMTGLLDRMEADGLIERRPDPNDRRALTIHLTEEGRALREPVLGVVARMLARATRGIGAERLDEARDVLRHFLENMQAEKQEAK
ncbi:MAG: MarR family transcriptional regulator [Deltaproteobacteria bacterium]|nr:MAG: MarR family transcriptional regulator [Deltaproteobacteria bacterium]